MEDRGLKIQLQFSIAHASQSSTLDLLSSDLQLVNRPPVLKIVICDRSYSKKSRAHRIEARY